MNAHEFQNCLRIMNSLDEVSDVIGDANAGYFHRDPMQYALSMDEGRWAKVFALIEKRMGK